MKLFTNIKNGDTSHENPYFGQCDGGTWKQGRSPQIYTVRQCVTLKKGTF